MDEADKILSNISEYILNPLIGLAFTVAFVYFVWGVISFIHHSADATKRKEGLEHIVWGLVGLAIMVSVYGLIRLVGNAWSGI